MIMPFFFRGHFFFAEHKITNDQRILVCLQDRIQCEDSLYHEVTSSKNGSCGTLLLSVFFLRGPTLDISTQGIAQKVAWGGQHASHKAYDIYSNSETPGSDLESLDQSSLNESSNPWRVMATAKLSFFSKLRGIRPESISLLGRRDKFERSFTPNPRLMEHSFLMQYERQLRLGKGSYGEVLKD